MNIVLIGLFGSLGVLTRYALGQLTLINSFYFNPTLIANALGCFIFGLAASYLETSSLKSPWSLYILIGFCGGLTTFSSFAMESLTYLKNHHYLMAISYVLLSVILGIVFLAIGFFCSQFLSK